MNLSARIKYVSAYACAALALSGLSAVAHAQPATFPIKGKPISIIVPYAAGGVTDTGARMMAAALEKELGTSVQVVNKVGAASQIGLTDLVRSTNSCKREARRPYTSCTCIGWRSNYHACWQSISKL